MSQISNDSNTQFYSPKSSTNQDQFKSAQDKTIIPFDEKSITPKSNTNSNAFNLKDQTPIRNTDFIAQFGQPSQQDTQQSQGQFFDYNDFPQMPDNDSEQAEDESSIEQQKYIDSQQQKIKSNKKQLKDLNVFDDIMNKKNFQNIFQSSEQLQQINPNGIQNSINFDQFKMNEIHSEKQNYPYFNDFSSAHQKTQQMAFTFHESNQFQDEGIQNITDSLQSQSFTPKPNFEVLQNNQFQPQQLDNNQNLNLHKTYSTPVQQNIFEQPKLIISQKSLHDDMPGSNISSQIRSQTVTLPQLNYEYPQNNPYQFIQQQPQQLQQIINNSPIQFQEIIKKDQQLNSISEQENKQKQNNNTKFDIKDNNSKLPLKDFHQELNLSQEISKQSQFIKTSNLDPIYVTQEFVPQLDSQSINKLQKLEISQQQDKYKKQKQYVDNDNLQFEDEEFQPNFPVKKETLQINQNLQFKQQIPITQIQIENINNSIQLQKFESDKHNIQYQPQQLYIDMNQEYDNNNRIMSHNSFKSFQESQQNVEEEIFYDLDNCSLEQDQEIQSQNLNQQNQQQITSQQQEIKITPRNIGTQSNVITINENKKNNPFAVAENDIIKDPKYQQYSSQNDYLQFEAKPELKKQLESITEIQEESFTQSQAIQNRNSIQFQENMFTEYQEKSIEESKVIQPSIKIQSQEIPSSFKVFNGFRESKDSNKDVINPQLLVEQIIPGLQDIIKRSFQSNIECKIQQIALQFQQKLQDEEQDKIDKTNSQVAMIENLVQDYGKKLDQITEMLNKEKENQEQLLKQKVQNNIQEQQQQQQYQQQQQICSPFESNLEDNQYPIQNQVYSRLKVVQSNYQNGFIPYQTLYQTQSQYFNESQIKENQVDNLLKYQTNYQFQKYSLKGLQDYEIHNFKKQCLSEQTTLLDTYELMVTLTSEKYESIETQGYRIIMLLKNKAQYQIQNLIIQFNSNKIKDEYIIKCDKINQSSLNPGDYIKYEIIFQYYDIQSVYLNCYIKYTINNLKMGQKQDYSNLYLSQMNSRYEIQEVGQFKRNFQFCIARPANKLFISNFITKEQIQEYDMKCQSEQFQLRSIEELIIFHPWLIQIDDNTVGGKVFIKLKNDDHKFVIKIVNKNQKGIVYMNGMDMDQKLIQHFLNFFVFLFSKLY